MERWKSADHGKFLTVASPDRISTTNAARLDGSDERGMGGNAVTFFM